MNVNNTLTADVNIYTSKVKNVSLWNNKHLFIESKKLYTSGITVDVKYVAVLRFTCTYVALRLNLGSFCSCNLSDRDKYSPRQKCHTSETDV